MNDSILAILKRKNRKMKKLVLLLFIAINSFQVVVGQIILTIEGTVVNNTETGSWVGENIPRIEPTVFTYRNNSITCLNTQGYILQAGDEIPLPTNNNLDNEIITGNRFNWNGINSESVITHGLFAGYNINSIIKYNYLDKVPYGILFKSGTDEGQNMTFTSGGCAYNICRNSKLGVRMKGINGVKVYNNTFYNGDGSGWYFILITSNSDRPVQSPSTASKIFNNIFYAATQFPMIQIESGCLEGFECDNNVYWCAGGEPMFMIDGIITTWNEWRALGYDTHSVIANPNFINTTDLVPSSRLDYGKNLGIEWQSGLSTTAAWIAGLTPATTDQNGTWQVGARVSESLDIPVSSITVTGASGATTITSDNGTLQLTASVLPANATNKTVTWSVVNETGQATINSTGLITAVDNGTVTARATSTDGSGISGTLVITITNQVTPVSSITVTPEGGSPIINTDDGILQLNASVFPVHAANHTVTWSILNGTGEASISSTGLVTAISDGSVTATATSNDGSDVSGSLEIVIYNQITFVSSISVAGFDNLNSITIDKGTLQLYASVSPVNATDQTVSWSINNVTGRAEISNSGLVTASGNGFVIARATANDGSEIFDTLTIAISNQLHTSVNENTKNNKATAIVMNGTELRLMSTEDFVGGKAVLYSIQGIAIKTKTVESSIVLFDVSSLPSGFYIALLSKGQNSRIIKVLNP